MKTLIKIFITAIIFVVIANYFQISAQTIAAKKIHFPAWIFASIFLIVGINPFLSCNRWKIFLFYAGINEKIIPLIKINFVSFFYGIVMPSSVGMDFVKIFLIEKRHPSVMGSTGSTVLAERLLGFFLLSIIGTISAVYLKFKLSMNNRLYLLMISITILLLFIIYLLSNKHVFSIVKKILIAISSITKIQYFLKIISYFQKLYIALFKLPLKKCFIQAFPFMLCFQLSNILVGYFLFNALGISLPFYIHLALLPIIQIIAIIPISVSGFGLREGAFAYFYSLMGVPPETSIIVSILYFIVSTGSGSIVGGLLVLFSNISRKDFIQNNTNQ